MEVELAEQTTELVAVDIHQGPSMLLPMSCLGDVIPFREPLKVCLDDSSSVDGDDDEDFYFGDDEEDFEDMDYYNALYFGSRSQPHATEQPVQSSSAVPEVGTSEANTDSKMKDDAPCLRAVVSDESSISHSSQTSLDSIATATSSTGALSQDGVDQKTAKSNKKEKSKDNKKRRVSLDQEVAVVPIPMRTEYCDRTRERLWSTATELYENAARNSIEFAAEGWNWRTVVEDQHMILNQETGEMIHPIHFHNLLMERGLIPPTPFVPNGGVIPMSATSTPTSQQA